MLITLFAVIIMLNGLSQIAQLMSLKVNLTFVLAARLITE